jgi:DNA-binding transcriptional LysR family regulator
MENLVAPAPFDPMLEKSHFRISGSDKVCTVVLPPLCRQYANGRYQVQLEFWPWRSGVEELVEHGQLDLVLHIDDGLLPSHFQSERLYREDWICAVARDSHFGDRLPLKQYLSASHIVVATYEGVQTIPDKQLVAVGVKRSSCIRVPYFGVALQCLPGTELVLTLTGGMTSVIKNDRRLRLVKAPKELQAFHFLMAWHPRLNTDPRHEWLRGTMLSHARKFAPSTQVRQAQSQGISIRHSLWTVFSGVLRVDQSSDHRKQNANRYSTHQYSRHTLQRCQKSPLHWENYIAVSHRRIRGSREIKGKLPRREATQTIEACPQENHQGV